MLLFNLYIYFKFYNQSLYIADNSSSIFNIKLISEFSQTVVLLTTLIMEHL